MEAAEYATLFAVEPTYWWFRALRGVLLDAFQRLELRAGASILDAGCGTGGNAAFLENTVGGRVVGLDVSADAAAFWPRRGLRRACLASIQAMPFRDDTFEAALSVNVLEARSVLPTDAYRELWRVLRPGGYLVLVVAAHDWLLDSTHHGAVDAARRFTRARVSALLRQHPVSVVRMSHLFATLLAPMTLYRWRGRLRRSGSPSQTAIGMRAPGDDRPRSDLRRLPAAVNEALFRAVNWERRLLRVVDLPFGSSILAIVRKASA